MSELIRPVLDDSNDINEIIKQREAAAAYLGEVSVALCRVNEEYIYAIAALSQINARRHGIDGA